ALIEAADFVDSCVAGRSAARVSGPAGLEAAAGGVSREGDGERTRDGGAGHLRRGTGRLDAEDHTTGGGESHAEVAPRIRPCSPGGRARARWGGVELRLREA